MGKILIEKLTTEQKKRFPEFVKKWTEIGLSTEKANRKESEEAICEMYSIAGLKKPRIVWCDSPLSQGLTRLIVQKLESDGKLKIGFAGDNKQDSVWDSVRASVRDVRDSVEASVEASVWASVEASVRDSVEASVEASVWASVGASVRDSVEASVGDVMASVRDMRDSVEASVVASVWDVRASVGDSGYGQHDANWLAFYDFLKEVCGLNKETKRLSGLWKLSKNAGWFLPHENICWVSERHIELRRDNEGRLHSDQEMSVKYPDGWGIYALNGVRLEKELWTKIISQKMTFKEIMAIELSDHRTIALKYNPEAIIKENAVLVHKDDRNNELYLIENQTLNKDLDFPKIWFLKMKCPTGRIFIEGVPPEEAEKNPNATDMQALLCGLTKSEYMSMILES